MPALYRIYRPQRFAEVVGQSHIVRTLQNASRSGKLAHAYLFTGSRGVGKTTLARLVAKAANCLDLKDGDPCGKCAACQAIEAGQFLDLVEIDAASHTGVDNVRDIIEHVKFKPSSGRMKVFIIDEVHMLSKAAFNALLKTLEEPPAHAIFILATTDSQKVPETIISRTQRFDFHRLTETEIVEQLKKIIKKEKLKISSEVVTLISRSSEGGLRDALSLLDKIAALGDNLELPEVETLLGITSQEVSEQLLGMIAGKRAAELPPYFEKLAERGIDFTILNRDFLLYLRSVLSISLTGNSANQGEAAELATRLTVPEQLYIIRLFLRSYKDNSYSPSPELPMLLSAIEASLRGNPAPSNPLPGPASEPTPAPKPIAEAVMEFVPRPIIQTVVQEESVAVLDKNVTREEVEAWWPDVITKVKAVNIPLATLLRNSPLHEVREGKVIIAVKYLFHKEHVESKKNYALITGLLTETSGKTLAFGATLTKVTPESVIAQSVDALGDALKVFGGELVE
jgi:DNA polymerase III subunit gamma/tau